MGNVAFGLNIFYSCRKYTETDWVRLKMRHYPLLQMLRLLRAVKSCHVITESQLLRHRMIEQFITVYIVDVYYILNQCHDLSILQY